MTFLVAPLGCIGGSTGEEPAEQAAIDFATAQVELSAESLEIDAADQTFAPTGDVLVGGWRDPANQRTELELAWTQHGVEMRFYLSLRSDGKSWWADQVRTYDGQPSGEWRTETGEFFKTPIGEAFTGDATLANATLEDVRLEAFTTPGACLAPANPVAILPLVEEVQAWHGPGAGATVAVILVATATCEHRLDIQHVRFDIESNDKGIVDTYPMSVSRGIATSELEIRATGTTKLTVSATDTQTGRTIDQVEIPVTVRPEPDTNFQPTTTLP